MTEENLDARRRKFWGWGFADTGISEADVHELGNMIHSKFGFPIQDLTPAPEIGEITLRGPRVNPPDTLAGICEADTWTRAEHTLGKNLGDFVRGLERKFDNPPDFVAFPRTEQDVVSVLDWAHENDVAVVPYGGGSSVAQGIEPIVSDDYRGAITLDLRHLNQVLEIDHESRSALIQGGVLGPDMENQLRSHGLTMRFFLQAFEFSTLGGWIATRAAGHFASGLTQIDDSVQALRVVTPEGTIQTRRLPADGAGVSADRLFIGSEGTLGVITQAWMRLQDRPTFRVGTSVPFKDFDKAVAATRALAQSGLTPANCRLLDPTESLLSGASDGTDSVLVLAFESADHPVDVWMQRAAQICADHDGRVSAEALQGKSAPDATHAGAAGKWRDFFVRGPYYKEGYTRMGILRETFETACTWSAFPELHARVVEATTKAARRECGDGVVACRFTHVYPDGPAPYYTVVAPAKRGAETKQWAAIKQAASEAVLAAGGTITHHHAVGRFHRPWYDEQRPELFASALAATKKTVDPHLVMNPGVLIDGK
ncbi:FAD-binding oxidoreductase [Pseudonocardia sp. C8]|uniref:FAD-binding oxidoreductase n=1 Tax=Pseudonocardia sp. C8 TaxID=2762759 RepID=UPI0016429B4D|nr:FAD-binding oxidoreductase [Pseudonocardia sp. C8]MBC3189549.1 FAD-binding oxidoreductase [Pseudonocardia sp. C8]